jgi:hypothetical protein
MGTYFGAEHLAQQLAAAVGDQVLLGEVTCGVDQAHHFDDALDLVQVAHCSVQGAHQINGHGTITYSNGDRYVGELWNGKPHGLGRKKFAEDRVPLEGRWDSGGFVRPERIR